MTTISATQVRSAADGRLTARCVLCRTDFVQAPGADVGVALRALDNAHPASSDVRHSTRTPAGWRLVATSTARP